MIRSAVSWAARVLASAAVAGTIGPGRYPLDALLGVRVPRWLMARALLGSAGLLAETIRPTLTPRLGGTSAAPQPDRTAEQETHAPDE